VRYAECQRLKNVVTLAEVCAVEDGLHNCSSRRGWRWFWSYPR